MGLNPTLWRTCRVLAGQTRLDLLKQVMEAPERCVTGLADTVGIAETRASQELRRLQSRGLIQAVRAGKFVKYRPVPDPQVASAKPLLAAMTAAVAHPSPETDAQTIRIAQAFSHARRLRIFRELLNGPCPIAELQSLTEIPGMALFRHLRTLKAGGVVRRRGKAWEVAPNPHPLAKTLAGLLHPRRKAGPA